MIAPSCSQVFLRKSSSLKTALYTRQFRFLYFIIDTLEETLLESQDGVRHSVTHSYK